MKKYVIILSSLILFILICQFIHVPESTPTEPTEVIETTTIVVSEPLITEPPTEPPTTVPYDKDVNWYASYRVYPTGENTTTAGGAVVDREFLAKLLFCEAGAMTWEGKVYTCSAILNFCDVEKRTLWEAGHDAGAFEVAPYVDYAQPTTEIYEVVDYVLSGGRIAEICYFKSGGRYHNFGTPVCEVNGHYFSKK